MRSTSVDRRRDLVVDSAIAAGFAVISAVLVAGVTDGAADTVLSGSLVAVHVGALLFRRRRPLLVLAAMGATALLSVPLGQPLIVLGPAVLVAVYTAGARTEPAVSRWALAATLAVTAVVVPANGMDAGTYVTNAVALAVAWWLGDRTRRTAVDAEQQQIDAAEAARIAAAAERLRIARELHDVVAHAMSVIAVQAGTGRFVIDESPDVARDALAAIETTSRAALEEMRRLLSVLREDDDGGGALLPAPGLRDLRDLVASTTQAGVVVDVAVHGDAVALPAGLDLCAYRVVQESLTNVRRHARARAATVTITYAPDCLHVVVEDDGAGPIATSPGGHGLVGMAERVGLYGGTLDAGPRQGAGFRVAAHLPLAGRR